MTVAGRKNSPYCLAARALSSYNSGPTQNFHPTLPGLDDVEVVDLGHVVPAWKFRGSESIHRDSVEFEPSGSGESSSTVL